MEAHSKRRNALALGLFFCLLTPAAESADQPVEVSRLSGLARLWGAVKYFHPATADAETLDWDGAALLAIPRVASARTASQYAQALQQMLDRLEDPLTRIDVESRAESTAGSEDATAQLRDDGILLITVSNYYGVFDPGSQRALATAIEALPRARAVVLDLRSPEPLTDYARAILPGSLEPIERALIEREVPRPGQQRRVYYGHQGFSAFSSGQYRSGLFTEAVAPLKPEAAGRDRPLVVILNKGSVIPASVIPRQRAGRAAIVFEGRAGELALGDTMTVPLGEGQTATLRISEPILADGSSGHPEPDVLAPARTAGGPDHALDAALDLARDFRASEAHPRPLRATATIRPERSYVDPSPPDEAHRILAAFRFWNVIEYFYPYRDLLDEDWDVVLPALIQEFREANSRSGYARAVVAAARRLHDGHAYVAGGGYESEVIGEGYPPIRVRLIEGKPVVTALYDAPEARRAGLAVGDVILSVDGEPATDRLERYEGMFSASTPQGLVDRATLSFMNGPLDSRVRLRIQRANGEEREVLLARRREDYNTLYHRERSGEVIQLLPGNIGYVDLDRLGYDEVDAMFERLRDTDGIVFDMRGYPNGTVFKIAPRLSDQNPVAALLATPMPGHPAPVASAQSFAQRIGDTPPGAWLYRGRTAMLMDERSQSQAEHTGLFLKAANGTVLVGSPTSGANGEITTLSLPGGMTVGFTGQSVTWPDGRRIQRVGLLPDVEVRPTIKGVREGRDEVLDAATRYLETVIRGDGPATEE